MEGTNPFVEAIAGELDGAVGNYTDAIAAVTAHEAFETFFFPHLDQSGGNAEFVFGSGDALDLKKDLEAFERRD